MSQSNIYLLILHPLSFNLVLNLLLIEKSEQINKPKFRILLRLCIVHLHAIMFRIIRQSNRKLLSSLLFQEHAHILWMQILQNCRLLRTRTVVETYKDSLTAGERTLHIWLHRNALIHPFKIYEVQEKRLTWNCTKNTICTDAENESGYDECSSNYP